MISWCLRAEPKVFSLAFAAAFAASCAPVMAQAQSFGAAEVRCVLVPWSDTMLSSTGKELVSERFVSRGDRVQAGDVLITFFEGGIGAKIDRANAQLELAQSKFDRAERLRGVITAAEREEAAIDLRLRQADVAELAEERARYTIVAPHNGIVIDTMVDVGEVIEDGRAIRLVDIDQLRAELDLPLRYLNQFTAGDAIGLSDEAGQQREGRVIFVDPVVDIASRSFRLHVRLDNSAQDWIAGSQCEITGLNQPG